MAIQENIINHFWTADELLAAEFGEKGIFMPRDTTVYGNFYWCVKVDRDISPDGEIYLMANSVEMDTSGSLRFKGNRNKDGGYTVDNLIIGPGKWKAVYAASMLDGAAVAVEYWKSEITNFYDDVGSPDQKKKNGGVNQERAKMTQRLRLSVLERDEFKCKYCGKGNEDGVRLDVDHITPVSRGGRTEYDNLQTLCTDCNIGKSNRIIKANGNGN